MEVFLLADHSFLQTTSLLWLILEGFFFNVFIVIVGLGSHLYIELNCNFNHDHIHLFILFSYLLAILRNSPILYSINVEPNLLMLIQD